MLHQVGDLFELNVKLRCQKVQRTRRSYIINGDELKKNIAEVTYDLMIFTPRIIKENIC